MRLAVLALLAGCGPWRQETSRATVAVQATGDRLRGGELAGDYEINGVGFSAAVTGQQLERDEPPTLHRRDFGGGIELGLSVSPLGVLANNDQLTRWFDLGVAGAAGGGLIYPGRLTTYGQVWGGGWIAIGLWHTPVHPSLIVSVRRAAVSEWDNETVFTVGLAWSRRLENGSFWGFGFR